ncbi:MAG: MFS transporter [Bdellovibrionota bacterium]
MRINWFLILLAYSGLFFYGLVDNSRGPVFPDILATFQLSDSMGSVFFFLGSFAATMANATAFIWLKRWPALVSFRFFICLQTFGLAIVAWGPTYSVVLVGVFFFGLSLGGYGLLVNVLASEASVGDTRRRVIAGLHAMYGVSSLIAPLAVTLIYSFNGTWRTVLGGLGVLPLIVVFISFFRRPSVVYASPKTDTQSSISFKAAFPYVAMIGIYVLAEVLLSTRIVLYARRELGYTSEDANFLLSGFFMALFAGRIAFTMFRLKTTTRRLLILSAAGGLGFYMLGLLVHPLAFVGCGLSFSFFYPCAMADVGDKLGADRAAVVMSWIQTFQSLAIMSMHFTMGLLSDHFGLNRAMWLGVGAMIVVMILLWRRVSLGESSQAASV